MTPDPAVRVRPIFHSLALALMTWEDPPLMGRREYAELELTDAPYTYRPYDPQGEVEPFDIDADWEDTGN